MQEYLDGERIRSHIRSENIAYDPVLDNVIDAVSTAYNHAAFRNDSRTS